MLYLGIVIAGIALVVIAAACVVGVVILWKSKNSENDGDEYEGEHSMAALKFSEIEFDTDESISQALIQITKKASFWSFRKYGKLHKHVL